MAVKYILAEDGSYINEHNVTRLFTEENLNGNFYIKASTTGPGMPLIVATCADLQTARLSLQSLIRQIEE